MTVQTTGNEKPAVGIPIQLHGPRLLLLDKAALALAKERFSINTRIPDIFESEMTVEMTCSLLWAGVRHQGGGPKLKTIRKIVTEENVARYALLIAKAICLGHSVKFNQAFEEEVNSGNDR